MQKQAVKNFVLKFKILYNKFYIYQEHNIMIYQKKCVNAEKCITLLLIK